MPVELIGLISAVSVLILTAASWLVKRALQNAQQPAQAGSGQAATHQGYPNPPPPRAPQHSAPDQSGGWHSYAPPMPNLAHALGPLERAQNQAASELFAPLGKMIGDMSERLEARITGTETRISDRMDRQHDETDNRLRGLEDRMARLETKVDERTKRLSPPRATRSVD